jgi:hypothetical protein
MASTIRTLIASLLAIVGSWAVYYGAVFNMSAIGSELGYGPIVLGVVLLGAAPLLVRSLPSNRSRSIVLGILRYLSMPVFVLGAFFILVGGVPMLFSGSRAEGLVPGIFITFAGLFAITWPEALTRLQRKPLIRHHES